MRMRADKDADWCSYVLYGPLFRNSADADADMDADRSILAIIHCNSYCKHDLVLPLYLLNDEQV